MVGIDQRLDHKQGILVLGGSGERDAVLWNLDPPCFHLEKRNGEIAGIVRNQHCEGAECMEETRPSGALANELDWSITHFNS